MGFPRGYPERRPPSVISRTSDRRSRKQFHRSRRKHKPHCEAHTRGALIPGEAGRLADPSAALLAHARGSRYLLSVALAAR